MPALDVGSLSLPRDLPSTRESLLSAMLGIAVTDPNRTDTVVVCVCAGVYALTAIMLVYAWCNYSYRPIKAKNLGWVSLMYLSTILWFIGNIPTNGHVHAVGGWSKCKVWVVWLRILFCFVFASLMIIRFYALDRVFNQRKPFTAWGSAIALAIAVVLNVAFCLVSQLISDSLTVEYVAPMAACNTTQGYRTVALAVQWALWIGVGFLIFRLRNIQSSFNEFRESIAIFAVAIALLIESTVTYIHYRYFSLQLGQRIQKTVIDTVCTNLIIWLIIAYPAFMCLFRRRQYEQKWMDMLAWDSHKAAPRAPENQKEAGGSDDDINNSVFESSQLNFGADDTVQPTGTQVGAEYVDLVTLRTDATLDGHDPHNDDRLPVAMRTNLQIRRPVLNNPALYDASAAPSRHGARRML